MKPCHGYLTLSLVASVLVLTWGAVLIIAIGAAIAGFIGYGMKFMAI